MSQPLGQGSHPTKASPDAGTLGPQECAECHVEEFAAWQESQHQLASKGLTRNPEASTIAKALGIRRIKNDERCTTCHADAPTHIAFPAAPLGVVLDTDERILAEAARIHQQTVVTRVMPIGNLTAMTDEERQIIDTWYQGLQVQ